MTITSILLDRMTTYNQEAASELNIDIVNKLICLLSAGFRKISECINHSELI